MWWREYSYRKLFGLTHEQYLDEPAEVVGWLLAIDGAVRKAESERNRPQPAGPQIPAIR